MQTKLFEKRNQIVFSGVADNFLAALLNNNPDFLDATIKKNGGELPSTIAGVPTSDVALLHYIFSMNAAKSTLANGGKDMFGDIPKIQDQTYITTTTLQHIQPVSAAYIGKALKYSDVHSTHLGTLKSLFHSFGFQSQVDKSAWVLWADNVSLTQPPSNADPVINIFYDSAQALSSEELIKQSFLEVAAAVQSMPSPVFPVVTTESETSDNAYQTNSGLRKYWDQYFKLIKDNNGFELYNGDGDPDNQRLFPSRSISF